MDKKVIIGLFATLLILVAIIYFAQSLNNKNIGNVEEEINISEELNQQEEIVLDESVVIMNNVQNELHKLIDLSIATRMEDGNYANIYNNEAFVATILGIKEIDKENMHPFSVISDDNMNFCVSVEYMGDVRCVDSNGYLGASLYCSESNYLCTSLQLNNSREEDPLNSENEISIPSSETDLPIFPEETIPSPEIDLPTPPVETIPAAELPFVEEETPVEIEISVEPAITLFPLEEEIVSPQEIVEPEPELTFEEKENIMVLETNLRRLLDSEGMQWIYINEKEYGPYKNAYIYNNEEKWGVANTWNEKWYVNINNKVYGPYVSKPEIELYDDTLGFYYQDGGQWFINIGGVKHGPYNNLNEVDFDQIL